MNHQKRKIEDKIENLIDLLQHHKDKDTQFNKAAMFGNKQDLLNYQINPES